MNITEFAALKVGDRIVNAMTFSKGEVVETTDSGVRIRWDGGIASVPGGGFHPLYHANGTAWFHWEPEPTGG